MKKEEIKSVLEKTINGPSKWELDNIIWADRLTNSTVLFQFLTRIDHLNSLESKTKEQTSELQYLEELLDSVNLETCENLLNRSDTESKEAFIENLARTSAIEVLSNNKLSFETMNTTCKLSPNDFIICAKRTQDIINSVRSLVIKGENLSTDIAGA